VLRALRHRPCACVRADAERSATSASRFSCARCGFWGFVPGRSRASRPRRWSSSPARSTRQRTSYWSTALVLAGRSPRACARSPRLSDLRRRGRGRARAVAQRARGRARRTKRAARPFSEHLHARKIIRPSLDRLLRLIARARAAAPSRVEAAVAGQLAPDRPRAARRTPARHRGRSQRARAAQAARRPRRSR
jgi:hypothetical protein